ncbi:hypothetical protein [Natranaeroarchaeum aerophilus]|uniref:Uncharacterized protein n=1 Tax=Natranaeroarchaeum aerophilus TaxID=2917711 RepID=A0AAE3FU86_9EURY|nr:hypothetical protein [Natranaeroarchaeum aerophilus]MCL9815043.1 hypothetical protein [Natranaeroarchaeum aerophilus]
MAVDSADIEDGSGVGEKIEQRIRRLEEILKRPRTQQHIGRSAGLFLVAGIGFGVSGLLVGALSGVAGINSFAAQTALGFAVLLLPLVALGTGTLTGLTFNAERDAVLLAAGLGAAFGSVVTSLVVYLLALLVDIGGIGATLSVGALVGISIGTAVTATLAALITRLVR